MQEKAVRSAVSAATLLQESNSALRRPGWFGGKMTLRLYFEAMVFVDGCEQLGSSQTRTQTR